VLNQDDDEVLTFVPVRLIRGKDYEATATS